MCVFFFVKHFRKGKTTIKIHASSHACHFATCRQARHSIVSVSSLIWKDFFLNDVFKCREMGWRSWNDHRGNMKYKMPHYFITLSEKDKVNANYVTNRIHGLTFNVGDHEHPKPQDCLYQDVYELNNTFKTPQQDLVGYKRGHFEKDVLNKLNIPCINLEEWGCPKFKKLMKWGFPKMVNCGHHIYNSSHCAAVECEAFWQWLVSQSTSYSNPYSNILNVRTWMDNIKKKRHAWNNFFLECICVLRFFFFFNKIMLKKKGLLSFTDSTQRRE